MRILGMDLGQSKSAWELLDEGTGEVRRGTVSAADEALRKLLTRLGPELLVAESGPLAARAHDVAVALGVRVVVADAAREAWLWRNVKRKTDADDAAKLVRLATLNLLHAVHIPAPAVRERRHLQEYRQALVAEITRCKNRLRATLLVHELRLPPGKTGWSGTARAVLAAEARPLAECGVEALWRGVLAVELEHLEQTEARLAEVTAKLDELAATDLRVRQLRSIPGVGPRTAEVVVTVLDTPGRFRSRREVSAYAGLVPRRFQSGQMDRSGRITKRGSPLLRQVLNQAAWVAVRCNPELRAFYLRVGGKEKKRRKQAIVAVMRKLLVLMWALLRDGTVYRARPPAAGVSPAA